jgi:hypothetical protein
LFTTLDLTTGRQRFLGRAAGQYDWCQLTRRYLACQAGVRSVRIWRLIG